MPDFPEKMIPWLTTDRDVNWGVRIKDGFHDEWIVIWHNHSKGIALARREYIVCILRNRNGGMRYYYDSIMNIETAEYYIKELDKINIGKNKVSKWKK